MQQISMGILTALMLGSAVPARSQDEVRLRGVPSYVQTTDRLTFTLTPRRAGYLLVVERDPATGWSERRFPLDDASGGWVQGGRTYALSDGNGGRGQRVGGPPGQRDLYVLWQPTPFPTGTSVSGPRRDGLEVVGADRMHPTVDLQAFRPSATYWVAGMSRPAPPPVVLRGGAAPDPWLRHTPRWVDPWAPVFVVCVGCDRYRWSTWPDPYWVPGWDRGPWGRDRWHGGWRDGDPWRLHDPWRDPWRPDPWRIPSRGGRVPDRGTPGVRPVAPPEWRGRSRLGAPDRPGAIPTLPATPRVGGSSGGSTTPVQPTTPVRPSVPPPTERSRPRPSQGPTQPTPVPPMTAPVAPAVEPERAPRESPPARSPRARPSSDRPAVPHPEPMRPEPRRPEPTRPTVERVPTPRAVPERPRPAPAAIPAPPSRPAPMGRSAETTRPASATPAPAARSRPPTRPVDSPS